MKKQLLLFISIFFLNTAFSQSWQEALNKLNNYLGTYNGGYYGSIKVKDGWMYFVKSGTRAKLDEITVATMENKNCMIQCRSNGDCFYSPERDSYFSSMDFSTYPKKESLNLMAVFNDFLNAYHKENVPPPFAENSKQNKVIKPPTGCVSGNCDKGFGKYVYADGNYYEGNFKKGQYEGKGTFVYSYGGSYTGDFKDGQQMGIGKITKANGTYWEGQNIYGNPNGFVKMTFFNGCQYTGIMDRWYRKDGEGTYSLHSGFSVKGIFKEDKPVSVEYFDAENKKITKEIFDTQEKNEIVIANENYKQQYAAKLKEYIQKNRGVIVQNINIPIKDVADLSDMSYRNTDIDVIFSNKVAGLFCIKRKETKPGNFDIYEDEITAFSVNSQRRVISGFVQHLQRNDLGKDIIEEFNTKFADANKVKLNNADTAVIRILNDLNTITLPFGTIIFVGATEDKMIFKDQHGAEPISTNSATYYFINRKKNVCEKIVNINTSSDLMWNEDFTISCLQRTHLMPENLVPSVVSKYGYYSIFYLINWETSTAKHLDDHIAQLNYLNEAFYAKNQSDAKWEASRADRDAQSRKDWDEYYESQRKLNEEYEKSKAERLKTGAPKVRYYYYNSVGNKVFDD
jgi:hypothetical protein